MRNPTERGNPVPKNPKPEPDDKEQSERFIEKAKELESDESGKIFEEAFKVILPEKNQPSPSKNRNKDA
jgi:hypothetical protein